MLHVMKCVKYVTSNIAIFTKTNCIRYGHISFSFSRQFRTDYRVYGTLEVIHDEQGVS
jgi:hypothetical protein